MTVTGISKRPAWRSRKLHIRTSFDALHDDFAITLRSQDFDRPRKRKNYIENSAHFEYATYLPARDMACLGLLAIFAFR